MRASWRLLLSLCCCFVYCIGRAAASTSSTTPTKPSPTAVAVIVPCILGGMGFFALLILCLRRRYRHNAVEFRPQRMGHEDGVARQEDSDIELPKYHHDVAPPAYAVDHPNLETTITESSHGPTTLRDAEHSGSRGSVSIERDREDTNSRTENSAIIVESTGRPAVMSDAQEILERDSHTAAERSEQS